MIVLIGKILFYLIIYCDCPTIKFYITKLSIDMYFIDKVYLTPLFYFLFTSGGIKLHFEQKKDVYYGSIRHRLYLHKTVLVFSL